MAAFSKAFDAALNEDYKTAFDLWLPLAEDGNASAQFNIGLFYRLGLHVETDIKEAMRWYKLAGDQGNHFAIYAIRGLHQKDLFIEPDESVKRFWFDLWVATDKKVEPKEGIDHGNWCNFVFDNGIKGPLDEKQTARFYQNLADAGNADAQHQVGSWYVSFSRYFAEINKDNKKANEWFEKAARQGHGQASFDLIVQHVHAKDFVEGYKWVVIAQEFGNPLVFDLPTLEGFNKFIAPTDKDNPPLFSQADLEKGAEMGRSWLSATAL